MVESGFEPRMSDLRAAILPYYSECPILPSLLLHLWTGISDKYPSLSK